MGPRGLGPWAQGPTEMIVGVPNTYMSYTALRT